MGRARCSILFFARTLDEAGWRNHEDLISGWSDELQALERAALADLVERYASEEAFRVVLYETDQSNLNGIVLDHPMIERVTQSLAPLEERMKKTVESLYALEEGTSVVVFLGHNPLYPPATVMLGTDLLCQEDEVVVIVESTSESSSRGLFLVATKSFHPSIYYSIAGGTVSPVAGLASVGALLMPLRPYSDIVGRNAISSLNHEVERRFLLREWYPQRTREVLQRMQRKNLLAERT